MAAPAEPDLPEAPARARSALSAAELAVGLITEELRSHVVPDSNAESGKWQEPDFFRNPPVAPTVAARISQYRKNASRWGGAQIRRMLNRSTYVDVVSRQSGKRKKEIARELWETVRSRKSLLRHYDNGVLPRTEDLIEKAGIKASTQHAHAMRPAPRLSPQKESRAGSPVAPPDEKPTVGRFSLHSDLARQSFVEDARAADRWLRDNPGFVSDPVTHPVPQEWVRVASTVASNQVAIPPARENSTANSESENVEVSIARAVQFIQARGPLTVLKVSSISNPIAKDARQYLPTGGQPQGKESAPLSSGPVATQGNSFTARMRPSR